MNQLEHLRVQIKAVDTKLMELIVKRLELAVAVGQQKRKLDKPIRNCSVERQVLDRVHRLA